MTGGNEERVKELLGDWFELELEKGISTLNVASGEEYPGFVVNRILTSAMSEVWRVTEEEDLDVKGVDKAIQESGTVPMGPYYLTDLLGLDTAFHVAEHLHESYGDRFYVSKQMKELVEAGNLGQKTGKGFYEHG